MVVHIYLLTNVFNRQPIALPDEKQRKDNAQSHVNSSFRKKSNALDSSNTNEHNASWSRLSDIAQLTCRSQIVCMLSISMYNVMQPSKHICTGWSLLIGLMIS